MNYIPTPIDTSGVMLKPEILQLAELLAENAHDVWARERLSQGWKYGPVRRDDTREHPCLVPYAQLPESEKVYDRLAAMETLKVVCALGYSISKTGKTEGD